MALARREARREAGGVFLRKCPFRLPVSRFRRIT